MKILIFLRKGDKFVHNKMIYTVYQHEGQMTEVFCNGRFWAWPNYNGLKLTEVEPFKQEL